ncbi:cytochrome b5 [Olea europaea subsp. europaea]|uniref:Cytochrome b5 n=1 Tax=Olea europaea subsp. europaea TaxID=158383 RepID=A0A8S0QHJ4_OLEEU|nr:cytochrome b5 [Olea europaea subsp. europaea]
MAPKVHTFEEVASHNKKDDCWLIISGKVYNVTPFLEEHPGGDEVLLTSTDATNDFEDVGHSDDAKVTMQKFYIGEIDESTLPSEQKYTPPPSATSTANQDSGSSSKILLFILPLLILGLAFVLRLYSKKE